MFAHNHLDREQQQILSWEKTRLAKKAVKKKQNWSCVIIHHRVLSNIHEKKCPQKLWKDSKIKSIPEYIDMLLKLSNAHLLKNLDINPAGSASIMRKQDVHVRLRREWPRTLQLYVCWLYHEHAHLANWLSKRAKV